MTVEIKGLGTNDSSAKDDKCNLRVIDSTYIYRPIDVKNPFISESWEKGENWSNNKYDFTSVIHSTTWSESTDKKIKITAKDIEELQTSNWYKIRDNRSPYIGLCDSPEDEVTKRICSALN